MTHIRVSRTLWPLSGETTSSLYNENHSRHTPLLMDSHELHSFYVDLHVESRGYKDAINRINIKRQSNGKTPLERRTVEMNNFQNPQVNTLFILIDYLLILMIMLKLSSHRPLVLLFWLVSLSTYLIFARLFKDMNRPWPLALKPCVTGWRFPIEIPFFYPLDKAITRYVDF